MSGNNITKAIQKNLDSSFLSSFARSKIDYFGMEDPELLEAYQAGIYDATVNFVGEAHLNITGTSQTIEEVKKFLRQASFNAELVLHDHKGNLLQTVADQEFLAETWFQENYPEYQYTQLILMIPKDNNRAKLSKIAHDFFQRKFNDCKYAYVEHTDTDIYHYHVIIEKSFNGDTLIKLRSDFISICIENQARLL